MAEQLDIFSFDPVKTSLDSFEISKESKEVFTADRFSSEEDPFFGEDDTTFTFVTPLEDILVGLNPRQKEAVSTLNGPLMVIAGPGSGKTSVLTRRIAALVADGVAPWRILAVTFTNKAAGEMKERLTALLTPEAVSKMWVSTFHSACLRILRYNSLEAGLPKNFTILDAADVLKVVKQILIEKGVSAPEASLIKEIASSISTAKNAGQSIDDLSFSARPADKVTAEYLHLYTSRLQLMGAVDFDDLLAKTLTLLQSHPEVLEKYQNKFQHVLVDEYQDTNSVQYSIVQLLANKYKNLCVVGDLDQCHPGGTLIETDHGLLPIENLDSKKHKVLSIPLGSAALWSSLPFFEKQKTFSSFNFSKRLCTKEIYSFSLNSAPFVKATSEHLMITRFKKNRALFAICLVLKDNQFALGPVLLSNSFFLDIKKNVDKLWILEAATDFAAAKQASFDLASKYNFKSFTYENNEIVLDEDFLKKQTALENESSVHVFAESQKQAFNALLSSFSISTRPFWHNLEPFNYFDVFTLPAQSMLPALLELPFKKEEKILWSNFAVSKDSYEDFVYSLDVADTATYFANDVLVHNCVYSWRGASPEAMAAFSADYPTGKIVVLEQNYRSTKSILEVARAIIAPNPATHRPNLFTDNEKGAPARLFIAQDDRQEASFVCDEIKATKEPYFKHAILFRTNSQSRVFEEELTRRAMPYQVVGALKFYDRMEVKDALSFIKLCVNPSDIVAFERCINLPRRGLGAASVALVVNESIKNNISVIDQLKISISTASIPKRARTGFLEFLNSYTALEKKTHEGPAAALEFICKDIGLKAHYVKTDKMTGADRAENLDELISSAKNFLETTAATSLTQENISLLSPRLQTEAFLENVTLVSAADSEDDVIDRVFLMTAHSSKGKEFPHVFVVGLEENLFPHARTLSETSSLEEERRLLFVAVSRSQEKLTLSRSISRYSFATKVENAPSRFLKDLPESVLVTKGKATHTYSQQSPVQKFTSRSFSQEGSYISASSFKTKFTPPPGPRLLLKDALAGMKVSHKVFGVGTILSLQEDRAVIDFAGKEKTLDLQFAPLEKFAD